MCRSRQILMCVSLSHITDWIAIDDWKLPDMLSFRLVRTSEETGITDADVRRAIELLGRAP